jgi:hypothetical protein
MKQLTYFFVLLAVSCFAAGCQSDTGPATGTAEDEQAIEDDTAMQEGDLTGTLGAEDDPGGAPEGEAAP